MGIVVEMDKRGRVLLPRELRKTLTNRRFEIVSEKGSIRLIPLPDVESLRGKYRDLIRSDWEELEERVEKFVTSGKR